MINVSKPSVKLSEKALIEQVLTSGWLGQGAKVFRFEEQCGKILQSKHFVALSSCTKSIEVALLVAGCSYGDEVIVPSLTYASIIQVIVKLGMVPVFADIDINDLNIMPEDIEKKITPKTRVILPLHFRGHSCKLDMIQNIAGHYNLSVIEDSAHAFGSSYKNKPVGSDSFMSCFSFGPLKNICCIEGGGIATNDDEIAQKLLKYRNLGMDHSTWDRYNSKNSKPWYYEVTGKGDKCQMNEVNAAVGLMQLDRINEIRKAKKTISERYISELLGLNGIVIPEIDIEKDFTYIFTILVEEKIREKLMDYLWNKGIGTAVHYYPNHLQPYFVKYNKNVLPNTEKIGSQILTLPSYTDLSESDQSYVIDEIKRFINNI